MGRWSPRPLATVLALACVLAVPGQGQSSSSSSQQPPAQPAESQPPPDQPAPPRGKILFSRDADSAAGTDAAPDPAQPPQPTQPAAKLPEATAGTPAEAAAAEVTDAEREAITFTAYDLDAHIIPASSGISVRAGLTVRNDSAAPLTRFVLQVSSTLRWEAISERADAALIPLHFTRERVETDADHTGWMSEAVVTLPEPLAPSGSIALTALYSGTIAVSLERLDRIGAPAEQARFSDWDSIGPAAADAFGPVALRGFGNVLWYPVSAAPVFLGDGAKLFQAVGQAKLRQSAATTRLRLAVEYVGDPPDTAYFCDHAEHLLPLSDNVNVPIAEAPGVATATFDALPLGFRGLSLFVTSHPATLTDDGLISAVTENYDALPSFAGAARMVEPMLADWLGPRPLTPLTLLDHPGQPFEDDALLVRPIAETPSPSLAPALAHALTHAWIHSRFPWIDEGLPQFMGLLWTERSQNRALALAQLQDAVNALALAEPPPTGTPAPPDDAEPASTAAPSDSPGSSSSSSANAEAAPEVHGQPLIAATSDLYFRTKAAAVWWMLRGIVGDDLLKKALQAYRANAKADRDAEGFERTLELSTQKDLHWFFDDWVYHDRGLPDLSVVSVTPRQMAGRGGRDNGWLVAVTVRNDGDAVADVPITVRSTTASETDRLRVPGRSSASIRILFVSTPDEVVVNGGEVPEVRGSTHTVKLVLPAH